MADAVKIPFHGNEAATPLGGSPTLEPDAATSFVSMGRQVPQTDPAPQVWEIDSNEAFEV